MPGELEAASNRPTSPLGSPPSPNAMASPQHSLDGSMSPRPSSPNAMASPQHSLGGPMSPPSSPNVIVSPHHSLDGSATSGYPTPHLSSDSSESGYSWLLSRPPRLSLYESVSPYLSSSGSSERSPSLPLLLQGLPSPPSSFSSPGSLEIPPSPALPGSDQAATETSSPPERFTPSRHSSSLSSMSWHSDGLAPSHNSISEGSPPTETPQDNVKFFNKIMMKKLGIVVGVVIVGGIVGGIVGSQIKHRDSQDS